MFYYELALLKSPLNNLIYQSEEEIKIGSKVLVKLQRRKVSNDAVVIQKVEKPEFKCVRIEEITEEYYDKQMLETAKFVSQYYVCSLGEALSVYIPFNKQIIDLNDKYSFDCNIELSNEQTKAYDFLNKEKQALLFANTGSGKTEIYIKIIENHLNENKQAILLMPEISLTPQMQKRLEKVFDKSVAIWH